MFTFYHTIWSMSSMNRKGTSKRPKCLLVVMKTTLERARSNNFIGVTEVAHFLAQCTCVSHVKEQKKMTSTGLH